MVRMIIIIVVIGYLLITVNYNFDHNYFDDNESNFYTFKIVVGHSLDSIKQCFQAYSLQPNIGFAIFLMGHKYILRLNYKIMLELEV